MNVYTPYTTERSWTINQYLLSNIMDKSCITLHVFCSYKYASINIYVLRISWNSYDIYSNKKEFYASYYKNVWRFEVNISRHTPRRASFTVCTWAPAPEDTIQKDDNEVLRYFSLFLWPYRVRAAWLTLTLIVVPALLFEFYYHTCHKNARLLIFLQYTENGIRLRRWGQ